jgi:hypothetical protein
MTEPERTVTRYCAACGRAVQIPQSDLAARPEDISHVYCAEHQP